MSLAIPILAFLLGFFSATYFAMRSADIASVNDHIEDLRQVENYAISYWLGTPKEAHEIEEAAHRLRGKLHATSVFRPKGAKLLGRRSSEYIELDGELYDLATGGTFQTRDYQPDPARAINVMKVCNQMRSMLRECRKHIYWVY